MIDNISVYKELIGVSLWQIYLKEVIFLLSNYKDDLS